MDRKSVAVLILIVILTVSVILAKSSSYDFFDDQARDYYDTLYQREIPRERVKSQRLNVVDFKMPGIHPEKVSLLLTKQPGKILLPTFVAFSNYFCRSVFMGFSLSIAYACAVK